jgi:hypothetical protein
MPNKRARQKQPKEENARAEKPTQKRALAEALRHLGPDASHTALARFVRERCGMKLTFCILVPKAGIARKPKTPAAPRRRCA